MNTKKIAKYLGAVALDESLEEHDKKYHPEGYQEGDTCNRRANEAKLDRSDAEVVKQDGSQQDGVKVIKDDKGFDDRLIRMVKAEFPGITDKDAEHVFLDAVNDISEDVERILSEDVALSAYSDCSEYSATYSIPAKPEPFERLEKNEDGDFVLSRKLVPEWSSEGFDAEIEEHNESLRDRFGVELRRDAPASESEVDDSEVEIDRRGEYAFKCEAKLILCVVNEKKFDEAYMERARRQAQYWMS